MKIFVLKPLGFRKRSHCSEMQNNPLMHREGLKGKGGCGILKWVYGEKGLAIIFKMGLRRERVSDIK